MATRSSITKNDQISDANSVSDTHVKTSDASGSQRIALRIQDCYSELGFSFSTTKKWCILTVIFLVQMSMNFNTTLYTNGITGISNDFNIAQQDARWGAALFLITYAFGCELWAPWSEELGRRPVLQASLSLVNAWCVVVAMAPSFATVLAGRTLGGLSTAGGSVTLGMVADLFEPDDQQFALAYIVFSSVFGSILGPIAGGFVEAFLPWRWTAWIQFIFGASVQLLHLVAVPETRTTVLVDQIARRRREAADGNSSEQNVYGPGELVPLRERLSPRELGTTFLRPFIMLATEPIVLALSLLSGFSDALIFMQVQSYSLVYDQWGFGPIATGLAFLPIGLGYLIAWLSFAPAIRRNQRAAAAAESDAAADYARHEGRLECLLWLAPCLPAGLLAFAFTAGGPPMHWAPSMVAAVAVGVANYAVYMATVDYMLCTYGQYAASATGGNGWARDFLAGVLTPLAVPFYMSIGPDGSNVQAASLILFGISVVLVVAVYVVYWKGPVLRRKSPFAQSLAGEMLQGLR